MAVPTSITDLSVTAASNYPGGTDSVASNTGPDDYFRAHASIIRSLAANDTIAASAGTTDIGAKASTFLTLTGTAVTITGWGTVAAGVYKWVVFNAAHTVTYNATSMILIGDASRTFTAGDVALYVSEASGNWRELAYSPNAGYPTYPAFAASAGASLIGFTQAGTGAVSTTVQGKLRESVSMLDFMSVAQRADVLAGTGAIDVTTAMQSAIDSGAARIHAPKGRYKFTTTLKAISPASAPIQIYGDGIGSTIFSFEPAAYSAGNDTAMWFGNSTENVPSTVYECNNLVLDGFTLYVNVNTRLGLRLRESNHASVNRVFVGAESYSVLTNITCMLIDGCIDGVFEHVELAPKNGYSTASPNIVCLFADNSKTLDRSAGSGSGAGCTSSSFNNCYIHLGGVLGTINTNQCSFNDCIFESSHVGLSVGPGSFNTEFLNCYYEAINTYPMHIDGSDARVGANVLISGGYYQANNKSGYATGESFIYADNVGKLKVVDVQIYGTPCIAKTVQTTGTCHSILMDANPYALHSDYPEASAVPLTNPFATTNTSADLILNYTGHGLIVGDTFALKGFTTPLSGIEINQPYWKVVEVVTVDQVKVNALLKSTAASATTTGVGGSGNLYKFTGSAWGNFIIDSPDKVIFRDAAIQHIKFSKSLTAAATNTPLFLNGDGATDRYITKKWSYVMTGWLQRAVAQTVTNSNYAYLRIDLPSGYEQDLYLATTGDIAQNGYVTAAMLVGKKLPPGTTIRWNYSVTGAVGGYNYTDTVTANLYLAECNESYSIW